MLELCANAPALVVGQSVPVLLEQGVDARNASIPAILQILQGETSEEEILIEIISIFDLESGSSTSNFSNFNIKSSLIL